MEVVRKRVPIDNEVKDRLVIHEHLAETSIEDRRAKAIKLHWYHYRRTHGLPNYADGMEEMFRHPDYKATAKEREYPRIKARILKEGATKFDHKHAAETAQWERERQRMLLHE